MFYYKLSDIDINVASFNDIYNVDYNAIETFGPEPIIIYYYKDKDTDKLILHSIKPKGFVKENDKVSITRLLKSFPNNSSLPEPYRVEITNKHMIAYTGDKSFPSFRTRAIVLENTTYNVPLGLRGNDMNILYDANFRTKTRERQEFFKETELDENGNVVFVENEEVDAFKRTIDRYKPINVNTDSLHAKINIAYEPQGIDESNPVKSLLYEVTGEGFVNNKEISKVASADNLILTIFGDPGVVNCDCNDINNTFILSDFENLKYTGFKTGDPLTATLEKVGAVNDIYSDNADVCRWITEPVEYQLDVGNTFSDSTVRQTFMLNLFNEYQNLEVVEGKEPLIYNWNIVVLNEVYNEETEVWDFDSISYAYAPVQSGDECNPINTMYIENTEGDYGASPLDPFTNVFNIIGANIINA